uniref:Uncharacterized protein n=2 Tax=Meloidogyne TaxID=189290 RepID=A0A6V7VC64_MELEN|nr:unnamed protein product [Meloidogyne enterolobii]
MFNSIIISLSPIFLLFLILQNSDSAKQCYSGQNKRYVQKQCSSGSLDIDYVCHKYSCEEGRSPFVLRTCAPKSAVQCNAGSRICLFSKGKGKCHVCDKDFCND